MNEPLPQRWVDLIKYLNAKEQAQPEALQSDDARSAMPRLTLTPAIPSQLAAANDQR